MTDLPPPAPPQPPPRAGRDLAEMVRRHFGSIGVAPRCGVCGAGGTLVLGGLPCAPPAMVPPGMTPEEAQPLPVIPMVCRRCGSVSYLALPALAQSASPIIVASGMPGGGW